VREGKIEEVLENYENEVQQESFLMINFLFMERVERNERKKCFCLPLRLFN
jgi:hypothetical protein